MDIDFGYGGETYRLRLELGGQEAQKSHGLCRGGPDVANLPAGEVYFVPTGAEGQFPMKYEDGTLGLMTVQDGRVVDATLLQGDENTVAAHRAKLQADPATGELGELGFGTQMLPVSGRDIQDEKIFGTFHIATGRSDHLGGGITPDRFAHKGNATHDDILYSPTKTPEIIGKRVQMHARRAIGDGDRELPADRLPARSAGALMPANPYESDRLLAEYLLFPLRSAGGNHAVALRTRRSAGFCGARGDGVRGSCARCPPARARSISAARWGGRASSWRGHCREVVGIDFSHPVHRRRPNALRTDGRLAYRRTEEGATESRRCEAAVPAEIDRNRVRFEVGDACDLRPDLGTFDVALLINLVDRLPEPRRCLERLPALLSPGGQLVIASPFTWLEEYTPPENWLGGYSRRRAGGAWAVRNVARHAGGGFRVRARGGTAVPDPRARAKVPVEREPRGRSGAAADRRSLHDRLRLVGHSSVCRRNCPQAASMSCPFSRRSVAADAPRTQQFWNACCRASGGRFQARPSTVLYGMRLTFASRPAAMADQGARLFLACR